MAEQLYRMVPVDPRESTTPEAPARPEADPSPLLLTVEQAAHKLGLSRTTVYEEMANGRLFSVKLGTRRRIPLQSVEEYVARLCAEAPWSGRHPAARPIVHTGVQSVKGQRARAES